MMHMCSSHMLRKECFMANYITMSCYFEWIAMTLTKGTGRWFVISCASEESNQAVIDAPFKKKMGCREHLQQRTVPEKQFSLLGARINFLLTITIKKGFYFTSSIPSFCQRIELDKFFPTQKNYFSTISASVSWMTELYLVCLCHVLTQNIVLAQLEFFWAWAHPEDMRDSAFFGDWSWRG